jgi:hypothetical protein
MRKFLETNLENLKDEKTDEFTKGLRTFLQVTLDLAEKVDDFDFEEFLEDVNTDFEEENEFNKGLKTAHDLALWALKEGLE